LTVDSEKCVLGVSQLGGRPDQTSEAPFQDSDTGMAEIREETSRIAYLLFLLGRGFE